MAFSKEDTTDKVLMIISDKLRMPKENMKLSATFKDLGVDSLDFFEIVMGMEDLFGIEIKDESADKIATISDAVDLIHGLRTK